MQDSVILLDTAASTAAESAKLTELARASQGKSLGEIKQQLGEAAAQPANGGRGPRFPSFTEVVYNGEEATVIQIDCGSPDGKGMQVAWSGNWSIQEGAGG